MPIRQHSLSDSSTYKTQTFCWLQYKVLLSDTKTKAVVHMVSDRSVVPKFKEFSQV